MRTNKTRPGPDFPFRLLALAALLVPLVVIGFYAAYFQGGIVADQNLWGLFGNYIGGILAPVYSLAAFLGLLYTIHLQQRYLEKVEKQVTIASSELSEAANARKRAEAHRQYQEHKLGVVQFEESFFRLLGNQADLVSNFVYVDDMQQQYKGRQFFRLSAYMIRTALQRELDVRFCEYLASDMGHFTEDYAFLMGKVLARYEGIFRDLPESNAAFKGKLDSLRDGRLRKEHVWSVLHQELQGRDPAKRAETHKQVLGSLRRSNELMNQNGSPADDFYQRELSVQDKLQLHQSCFTEYYHHYGGDIGFYFRNLRNLLGFIELKCPTGLDMKFYAKLVRAQMSRYEIAMLFYNCLSRKSSDKFNSLVSSEGFNMLKGLYQLDLYDGTGAESLLTQRNISFRFQEEPPP